MARKLFTAVLIALFFTGVASFLRPQPVLAVCGIPGTPPCPPGEGGGGGGRKRPTPIPPPTWTPTATATATATATFTPSATPTASSTPLKYATQDCVMPQACPPGHPNCVGIKYCPQTPKPTATRTPTPVPPVPPLPFSPFSSILLGFSVLGGLLGGGFVLSRSTLSKRHSPGAADDASASAPDSTSGRTGMSELGGQDATVDRGDNDGINDAWEQAGHVDINTDGQYGGTAQHELGHTSGLDHGGASESPDSPSTDSLPDDT